MPYDAGVAPFDPLTIRLTHDLLASVAEEMGESLIRSALSPNITERRDCSCALFDGAGELVAQASHVPVHLGSMASAVREARALGPRAGDMVLLNDPFRGGAHLPDLTLVAPLCLEPDHAAGEAAWYVATRAHHADVGGMAPGSMAPATEIFQEGLILPPVRLIKGDRLDEELEALILANTRTPRERRGDLLAMVGANRVGLARLRQWVERRGAAALAAEAAALLDYSAARMRALIARLPERPLAARDLLDDDGAGTFDLPIQVTLTRVGEELTVDFAGSAPQTRGNVNAVEAVTRAALLYALAAVAGEELPVNAGCLRPVRLLLPPATVVNAAWPAAVASGNVETSQRIVDTLLRALAEALPDRVPAASQGTMNNVSFGGQRPAGGAWTWYETLGGGGGASARGAGLSAAHVHMSNTLNTPIETFERDLPVRVERYAVRRGSGGVGRAAGGDGLVREYRFLAETRVALSTERRRHAPGGLAGGAAGLSGLNTRVMPDGARVELPGKLLYTAAAGERLIVETPGGGGFGTP